MHHPHEVCDLARPLRRRLADDAGGADVELQNSFQNESNG